MNREDFDTSNPKWRSVETVQEIMERFAHEMAQKDDEIFRLKAARNQLTDEIARLRQEIASRTAHDDDRR